ncbi:hypothetical protein GQ55_4G083800 [Panicum hallii var. hallii]|uniref:DUF295 domain-containing protein n=1 Tax=Panicum hallii var. hallii TaxID=1504633 RepID=A0A2T7DWK0_9POAL|nr:hypothetical protein GQ55_4G083800 [Panicum hallii var. hallii]
MGLSRRFLNLIVEKRIPGAKSLRCIDTTRQHFFNTRTTQAAALKMERIWLPSPSFNFRAPTSSLKEKQMHCFPVGDRRVICADHSGNCFLVDAEMRRVVMMPHLHKLKPLPLSLFVPSTDAGDHNDGGGSLFVMERAPEPEAGCNGQLSHQFEAFASP